MLTPIILAEGFESTNVAGTTVTSGSFSVVANDPVIVNIRISSYSGTPPAITMPDSLGITWGAPVFSHVHGGGFTSTYQVVFEGRPSANATGTISMAIAAGSSVESFIWQVTRVPNVGARLQAVAQQGGANDPTSVTINLASLASASSGVVAVWTRGNGDAAADILVPSTDYLALNEYSSGSGSTPGGVVTTYKLAGTTTPGITSADPFIRINGVAFEYAAPSAGPSTTRVASSLTRSTTGGPISSNPFTAVAGGAILVTAKASDGFDLGACTDTAGNSYVPLAVQDAENGSITTRAWYCLSSLAQSNNVVTVAVTGTGSSDESLTVAHYTTTNGGFAFDTSRSFCAPRVGGEYATAAFNTAGPGVIYAGHGEMFAAAATGSGYAPFTLIAEASGAGEPYRAHTEYITSSAQTGLVARMVANDGRGSIYAISIVETGGGGGDTTAPVLSLPTGAQSGSTTASVGATTDEGNGTLYAVVTTSVTQPSVAQIKAGQNNGGTAAAWAGSQTVTSPGAKSFTATGLTASTTYYAHLVHTDAAGNDSNRVTSSSFTTAASGGPVNQTIVVMFD